MTKTLIIFPYGGFDSKSVTESLFWRIVDVCRNHDERPTLILNRDTECRGKAKAFLDHQQSSNVDIQRVWSVDTCQMWLHGWGLILDKEDNNIDRVAMVPGDVEQVPNQAGFFNALEGFVGATQWPLVIGDFKTDSESNRFVAKSLIDRYGTYQLLAIWFPDLCQNILNLPLDRPRSEYLNVEVKLLKELLSKRKFAYEQTLNMLIDLWDHKEKNATWIPWSNGKPAKPHVHNLGLIHDDDKQRNYRGCLDQIERTERLLKLRWREVHGAKFTKKPSHFITEYHRLEHLSEASRASASVTLSSLLGIGLPGVPAN